MSFLPDNQLSMPSWRNLAGLMEEWSAAKDSYTLIAQPVSQLNERYFCGAQISPKGVHCVMRKTADGWWRRRRRMSAAGRCLADGRRLQSLVDIHADTLGVSVHIIGVGCRTGLQSGRVGERGESTESRPQAAGSGSGSSLRPAPAAANHRVSCHSKPVAMPTPAATTGSSAVLSARLIVAGKMTPNRSPPLLHSPNLFTPSPPDPLPPRKQPPACRIPHR